MKEETHHKGVSLSNEDLNRVNSVGLAVYTFDLNYGHVMAINREIIIGETTDIDQTEPIANDEEGLSIR